LQTLPWRYDSTQRLFMCRSLCKSSNDVFMVSHREVVHVHIKTFLGGSAIAKLCI
jgi:hypothetical protein